ncbi:uncharacterized protein [Pyxicephalus adspersus]|uniref:uncharacterized protein n=1 Tax=Pyxicephalus adspersus TaxID=30357 RepID=UPI003B5C43AD
MFHHFLMIWVGSEGDATTWKLQSIPSISRQEECDKTFIPANMIEHWSNDVPECPPGTKHCVGIFSRSSTEDYSWLMTLLTSEYFTDNIHEVKPCYISNYGFQRFINDLSQCTFGILYHTKNRGRVNITDVIDSMYDEELDYLQMMLGQDNVIVVIDDLEDSSDQEKARILENQPSIGRLASDLFLISHKDKTDKMRLVALLKNIKLFSPHGEK